MDSRAFTELADQVAALLGDQWHTQPETAWKHAVRLVSQDGRAINLILNGGSITARGVLPRRPDVRHGPRAPEITMAAVSAPYVCGHIRRRLLATYKLALTQWLDLTAEVDAEQAGRAEVAELLAHALGAERITDDLHADVRVTAEHKDLQTTTVRRHRNAQHPESVKADVGEGGNSVELRVTGLTSDQAAALCRLIRILSPRPAAPPPRTVPPDPPSPA